ncbi:MAG: hypothetical protein JSS11_12980 [Verrucomicrobia bacterium]|nr:hypothetical protein [Verrucomicrobiota bacterium]
MVSLAPPNEKSPATFDWPLAYEAEQLVGGFITAFLEKHGFAQKLAARMRDETGTEFYEWTDHFALSPEHGAALRAVGFVEENVPVGVGATVLHHPKAMMPRVVLHAGGSRNGVPAALAIKPEVLPDFLAAHDLAVPIEGDFGARLRRALVAEENGLSLYAVERLGYRGFLVEEPAPGFAAAVIKARELFRTRRRNFPDDAQGVKHAFDVLAQVLALVPRDVACELFFAEERVYWEFRNRAGRVQKRRQDTLGLGWGNHDHHTFRCSRRLFADLVEFLTRLGLEKRERFYAGDEAGWGAQVMEAPAVGIVVFADVDLQPGEIDIDFAAQRLPELKELRTVGLWCGLHGDSFLQAGMHHLEARFDFARLRDQLAAEGVATMKPFSDFAFLKQAFTEGERWRVRPERVAELVKKNFITPAQADGFIRDGAIGSHLENLQRKGGFKGFNQKAVSAIIAATDPRKVQAHA